MEALLKTEAYSQPFSIMCMELCIKDVHEATQDFLKQYHHHQTIAFGQTPSWKYPHIRIDQLDILPIIEKCRNKTFTNECQQYQELLELLIDRVCFSLMTTIKLLGSVAPQGSNDVKNETPPLNSSRHHGQGDGAMSLYKSKLPVLATKSSKSFLGVNAHAKVDIDVDNATNHPNVGLLLKQLFDTVNSILEARALDLEKNRRKSTKPKFCSTSTQSSDPKECETCLVAINLLKFLATITTECLAIFTETPSEIFKLRQDGEALWNMSQKEYLYEWCDAVQTDCKTLLEKASLVLGEKAALQKLYDEVKENVTSESQQSIKLAKDFHQKLKESEDAFELERGLNEALEQDLLIQTSRSNDLQSQLQDKSDEIVTLQEKVEELTKSLHQVTGWHKHLQQTSSSVEKAKIDLEQQVGSLKEIVHNGQNALARTEELVGLKDAEIDLLKSSLEKAKGEKMKKDEVKVLLEKARKQLEFCKRQEDEHKRSKLADKVTIDKLKEEVALLQEQVELLTLYPDLNGPIHPPTEKDSDNPLKAMDKQVRSNQLRIQVLQAQTERLTDTLGKCSIVMRKSSPQAWLDFGK